MLSMYSTRNKAVAAFLVYAFGEECYDHAELFDGQVYLFFTVDQKDKELNDYYEAFKHTTDLINECKLYAGNTPS